MTPSHSSRSQDPASQSQDPGPSSAPRLGAATDAFFAQPGSPPVEWHVLEGVTPYEEALAAMEARVGAIADGRASEAVLLLEHPPLYTAGTGARDGDLLDRRFPVFAAGRGGQYTYHGPGQRVAYVLLDLKRRRQDVRAFVAALEAWIIATLWEFHVAGERREDRVGVWVRRPERPVAPDGATAEDKIAAIGIRVRRWVTFHGISLNVDPDLTHFSGIVPCGIRGHGVTSLADLGILASMPEVDGLLRRNFESVFGMTVDAPSVR
ncbi:lipoyl(octanoyl) transferase LipB [Jiella pacifica]|uniref:Octanoyltransferase n=1 Tax=Jiella pacifica TaxID=2696469 RepID=A0A6N9T764_9HYPH|nr:lipoyl(octanoyl) transferase LipB [Jiella pacifica]NDW07254.1 lipoyl(octanoyl) transferase LipB [Jiella pacifica]